MNKATIYVKPGCTSCQKAQSYFKKIGIRYGSKKIERGITKKEIDLLISLSSTGFENVVYKKELEKLEEMTTSQAKEYIYKNPQILRTPIVFHKSKCYTGYNQENYGMFISKEKRAEEMKELIEMSYAI